MRITARKRFLCVVLSAAALAATASAAADESPAYRPVAKLASFLSDGEAVGALESFDKNMKGYGAIAENIAALAAQTEVLCSIDLVADKDADNAGADVHHLDLDWYLTLKSKADNARIEKRRMRVAVTVQLFPSKSRSGAARGVWRITSLSPDQILAPLTVK